MTLICCLSVYLRLVRTLCPCLKNKNLCGQYRRTIQKDRFEDGTSWKENLGSRLEPPGDRERKGGLLLLAHPSYPNQKTRLSCWPSLHRYTPGTLHCTVMTRSNDLYRVWETKIEKQKEKQERERESVMSKPEGPVKVLALTTPIYFRNAVG